ncbi:MAG: hypothetical protein ACJ8FY_01290 [Gemmataceae bacterium]
MPADPGEHYRVSFPGPVLEEMKRWAEQAKSLGIAAPFIAQLRRAVERLSTDPLSWGERRGTLHGRNLPVCHAALPLFHIKYAVDNKARVVFVMAVRPMPNSPLASTQILTVSAARWMGSFTFFANDAV